VRVLQNAFAFAFVTQMVDSEEEGVVIDVLSLEELSVFLHHFKQVVSNLGWNVYLKLFVFHEVLIFEGYVRITSVFG